MEEHNGGPVRAAKAVIARLLQMRQLWEDAAQNYFEPSRFMLALQNCITTSRTVTFILQANKSDIPEFDAWYEPQRVRWSGDPIMRWARDARNSIEKKGDLETYSQVRAEIIASYMKGPETNWVPQALFSSPYDIWRAVPAKFRVPHVVEHGTLLIERRWVDSELPTMEVLEALAHVYDDLCSTLIDFLETYKVCVPPHLDRSRPDAMGELAMDRAIYLSMRDGTVSGMRYFRKPVPPISPKQESKIRKRYKKGSWARLKNAKTLRDIAAAFFENARVIMARDGYHRSMTFLMKGLLPIEIINTDHPSRASRYVLMRDLARLAHIARADGVMMIAEAWTATGDSIPSSGFAVDAPDRGEAILLSAANASGESFQMRAVVERKRSGSKKVKRVGPAEIEEDGFHFLFLPFYELWGCLSDEKMKRALAQMDDMGIETPGIHDIEPEAK